MSTGLSRAAASGRNEASSATVSADNEASSIPAASTASAAATAGPPASVRMATRGPEGTGHHESARAQSNISSAVSARRTPARRKAAS